ncbi:MAG: nitroreductase family protein, partial [Verrucomicrobiota bacterium]
AQQAPTSARNLGPITLPKPEPDGGKSVLAALRERKTTRSISAKELPPQVLSNLLWAAFGVNREKGAFGKPGRTAASASNSQEIDLYVALADGVYLYEAVPHRLTPVVAGDLRGRAGRGAAAAAPVNIFYVVDLTRYDTGPGQPDRNIGDPEVQKSYYYTDTGLIAGNVFLLAASQGLAAWFHNCNRDAAARSALARPFRFSRTGSTTATATRLRGTSNSGRFNESFLRRPSAIRPSASKRRWVWRANS